MVYMVTEGWRLVANIQFFSLFFQFLLNFSSICTHENQPSTTTKIRLSKHTQSIKQISGFPGAGLGEGWWQSSIKEETFWSNENYLYFDVVVVIWLRTYFQTRQSGMMTLLHAIINHSIKSSFFFFNHCLLEVHWTGLGGHADVSWACSSSGWWARDQLTWTFFSFWKQQARLGMFTSWW